MIKEQPHKGSKKKLNFKVAGAILLLMTLIFSAVFFIPKIISPGAGKDGSEVSVAILPFQNLTNEHDLDNWQTGIQSELITNITGIEDLVVNSADNINAVVKQKGIVNYSELTSQKARSISKKS